MLSFIFGFLLIGSCYASPVASNDVARSVQEMQGQNVHVDGAEFVTDAMLYPSEKTISIIVKSKLTGDIVFEAKQQSFDTVLTWLEKRNDRTRKKRFGYVIPFLWGAAEIAQAIVKANTVEGHCGNDQ